jgi:hypothetical protein
MPFDKISPQQMFVMRILTALCFVATGGTLAALSGASLFGLMEGSTRFTDTLEGLYLLVGLTFGVFLVNAGAMLMELVTAPPMKMGINVPFVAGNFQTSLTIGLVALLFTLRHVTMAGDASPAVVAIQALAIAGFALNLVFVMMTKLHWNFTENTGKALPKAG